MRLILYDAYEKVGACDRAQALLNTLPDEQALPTCLRTALSRAALPQARAMATLWDDSSVTDALNQYCNCRTSVRRAQAFNALLPGAGYLAIGQPRAAATCFTLNALFIWAAVHFFQEGNIPAGIITTGFELGWYFGGISGAGFGAIERNERVYEKIMQPLMCHNKLFPLLTFRTAF